MYLIIKHSLFLKAYWAIYSSIKHISLNYAYVMTEPGRLWQDWRDRIVSSQDELYKSQSSWASTVVSLSEVACLTACVRLHRDARLQYLESVYTRSYWRI